MLSINKIYGWLFVFALLIQIPSVHLFKFTDEILVVFMMSLVFLDVVLNKQYKKYKMLWAIMGVMAFYMIYSLVFVSYNTPKAILQDFVAQIKPFCYFFISYSIAPRLSERTKQIVRWVCVFNISAVVICFVLGLVETVFMHVAYLGLVSIVSAICYLLCSIDADNKVSRKDLCTVVVMLLIGLVSTRSKYYGELVLSLYLLFFYVPGVIKKIKLKHIIVMAVMSILVLIVAWTKIDYYFISGGQEDMLYDEDVIESFARPVMYASMFVVLSMYPLFGSGLASFGTYASATNYSRLYAEIGIDNVFGLSEDYGNFICDAFYPELAQFGLVGIVLFVAFFLWVNKRLSLFLYLNGKILYVAGLMAIIVLLIESVASTVLNQGSGAMCMMILGYLVSTVKHLDKNVAKMAYKEKGALEYIRK